MNKYSEDNSAILDATGKPWPVETPHLLPLPEGIKDGCDDSGMFMILYSRKGNIWKGLSRDESTHWLARRPLPPVPKVKTQEELDSEFIDSELSVYNYDRRSLAELLQDAIAYARKGQQ